MQRVIGIDPGASGAIALLVNGAVQAIWDMPAVVLKVGRKQRRRIVAAELARIVREAGADHAFVENVNAMPGEGPAGAFAFGKAVGYAEMACAAIGVPVTTITPMEWKRGLSVPADKAGARARASQLLPQASGHWPLVKHDGRAEAALIALYGVRRNAVAKGAIEW